MLLFCRLPQAVNDAVGTLQTTNSSMNDFFTSADPSMTALADELGSLKTTLSLPTTTGTFSSQLSTAKINIQAILSDSTAFLTDLNSLITDLGTVDGFMVPLGTQLSAYPNPGTAGAYASLKPAADNIKVSVQLSSTTLDRIQANYGSSFTVAGDLETSLPLMRLSMQVRTLPFKEQTNLCEGKQIWEYRSTV